MSIWNKILIGLICVTALTMFVFAARLMKAETYWRNLAQQLEKRTEEFEAQNKEIQAGERKDDRDVKLGIDQLKDRTKLLVNNRGRVWRNCTPRDANPTTGQVRVTTDQPGGSGIGPKTKLFVFEEKERSGGREDGRYLGEFEAELAGDNNQVPLKPTKMLSASEVKRIAEMRGPWVLYERMPRDSHAVFAGMTDDQLKALIPKESLADYEHDGQKATTADVEKWKATGGTIVDDKGIPQEDAKGKLLPDAKGKFARALRDYEQLFEAYILERPRFVDAFTSLERDIAMAKAAAAEAKQQVELRNREIATLTKDVQTARKEQQAVRWHELALRSKLSQLKAEVSRLLETNRQYAAQVTEIQLKAASRIDARTPAAAATAPASGEGGT